MTDNTTKIDIPKDATDVVIFVHGFGVRWDSRGMFSDIQNSLPREWGSVLFDFYQINGDHVTITPVSQQVQKLKEMIDIAKSGSPKTKLHIVAHSKGCIITALALPDISGEIIFLAPPEQFGTKLEQYFQRYPGAAQKNDELIIPRKDGTTTHIPLSFFPETQAIDAEAAILKLSNKHSVNLLQTTKDEVIGKTDYKLLLNSSNINIETVPADHNFTGKSRLRLIEYIEKILT